MLRPASILRAALQRSRGRMRYRHEILRVLPCGSIGCEVGVFAGRFSAEILAIVRPGRLHLVDTWEGAYEMLEAKEGDWSGKAGWQPFRMTGEEAYAEVRRKFARQIASGQVAVHRCTSFDFLRSIEDSTLDWIYLDGDHAYECVSRELALARWRVKPGGWILGHDYCAALPGVIAAVDEFCVLHGLSIDFLTDEDEYPVHPRTPGLPERCAFNSFAIRNRFAG